MVDKLLIFLLIISFPIAAFLTNRYILKDEKIKNDETIAKVDAVIGQLETSIRNRESAGDVQTEPEITVSTVFYATESSSLLVSGSAPTNKVQLLLSAIPELKEVEAPVKEVVASGSAKAVPTQPDVLGQAVEVRALQVSSDGIFSFEYPLEDVKEYERIELRLEQAQSSRTIIYNFSTSTFEQF